MFVQAYTKTLLLIFISVTLQACSTVRDATDWVPGVDSNEEVQAEKSKEIKQKKDKIYQDKMVFEKKMTGLVAENDAVISVSISQKFVNEAIIKREDIGIEVNAGVVTLTGSVDAENNAVKAIIIAKNTRGVSMVISKLVVIKLRVKSKITTHSKINKSLMIAKDV